MKNEKDVKSKYFKTELLPCESFFCNNHKWVYKNAAPKTTRLEKYKNKNSDTHDILAKGASVNQQDIPHGLALYEFTLLRHEPYSFR